MSHLCQSLSIERLGSRGEGIARGENGLIFIPYALPGEKVIAEIEGSRGSLIEVIEPSRARISPSCAYFFQCGGCAVQMLKASSYANWKRDLVIKALQHSGLEPDVGELVDAHGEGRRRATFHARYPQGRAQLGYTRMRSHAIVEIESCPVLAPAMCNALTAARALAQALASSGKPLDILVTATQSGLDIDLKGHGPLSGLQVSELVRMAEAHDLARLSHHGTVLITRRPPLLVMGKALLVPPPGAFLQATEKGEAELAAGVLAWLAGAGRVADLFSGVGTFALRLAELARVAAFDLDEAALKALAKAANGPGFKEVHVARRDLFKSPLSTSELNSFEAVVFDPPRTGALAQARALAEAQVPMVVAVSCNAESFARDAAILCAGGYELLGLTPIDQFRHTPHVEILAGFRRTIKSGRKRRLLG